jgi:hypothetical protein
MGTRLPRSGTSAQGHSPELPAFCRTRRQSTVVIESRRINRLAAQLWLVVLLQLSILMLVIAGPFPPQPQVRIPKGVVPVPPHRGSPFSAPSSAHASTGVAGSLLPADPRLQQCVGSW